jgi:valyl-tRNA synthetase
MSKTTGNVLDPIAMLDGAKPEELGDYVRAQYPDGIPAMGADALRFTLLTGATPGNDMNLSLQRVEGNRNFTNKIWNATRFVLSQLIADDRPMAATPTAHLPMYQSTHLPERWILSRLSATIADCTRLMDSFQYGEAGRQAYDFFWSEFCDWYLEISKIALYRGDAAARARVRAILVKVLDDSLRLLHPFIPFVTEETWGYLKQAAGDASWPAGLIVALWPQPTSEVSGNWGSLPLARDEAAETDMGLVMDIIRAIRNARAEYSVPPGQPIAALISAGEREALIRDQAETICTLARVDGAQLTIAAHLDAPPQSLTLVTSFVTTYLPLSGLVDLAAERARLGKELADTEAQIARSEALLASPFARRAPAAVVQREHDKQAELCARADRLRKRLYEYDACHGTNSTNPLK